MDAPTSNNSERQVITTATNTKEIKSQSKPLNNNNESTTTINVLKTKPNGFDEKVKTALTDEYDNRHALMDDQHKEEEKGVPVQVLYSYEPFENDELTLIKGMLTFNLNVYLFSGEIMEFLSGPDNLGWCRGRKKHIIGYFPDGYVRKL